MRKPDYLFIVLIHILLLSGCYESEIPLSKSSTSQMDTKLIKSWTSIPGNNKGNVISLVLWKFNENELLVIWKEGEELENISQKGMFGDSIEFKPTKDIRFMINPSQSSLPPKIVVSIWYD